MEKNTVLLDLKTYNRLRDFHTEVTKGKIPSYVLMDTARWCQHFYTKDEAIKNLMNDNEAMETKIDSLQTEIAKLKYPERVKPDLKDVKKMSIWQFIKWRKS